MSLCSQLLLQSRVNKAAGDMELSNTRLGMPTVPGKYFSPSRVPSASAGTLGEATEIIPGKPLQLGTTRNWLAQHVCS